MKHQAAALSIGIYSSSLCFVEMFVMLYNNELTALIALCSSAQSWGRHLIRFLTVSLCTTSSQTSKSHCVRFGSRLLRLTTCLQSVCKTDIGKSSSIVFHRSLSAHICSHTMPVASSPSCHQLYLRVLHFITGQMRLEILYKTLLWISRWWDSLLWKYPPVCPF